MNRTNPFGSVVSFLAIQQFGWGPKRLQLSVGCIIIDWIQEACRNNLPWCHLGKCCLTTLELCKHKCRTAAVQSCLVYALNKSFSSWPPCSIHKSQMWPLKMAELFVGPPLLQHFFIACCWSLISHFKNHRTERVTLIYPHQSSSSTSYPTLKNLHVGNIWAFIQWH